MQRFGSFDVPPAFTPEQLKRLLDYLKGKQCARCGVLYEAHGDADHVWYEFSEDAELEERN